MDYFNQLLTKLCDGLLMPFRALDPIWGILFLSTVTGIIMVWLFGKTTNQRLIRSLKTQIKGHLLEMWLFRESLRLTLTAQRKVLWTTTKYAFCSFRALIVLMIPALLIMIQMQARYGWEPLEVGDSTIVTVTYADYMPVEAMSPMIEVSRGLEIETPLLRIPNERTSNFRVGVLEEGPQEIRFEMDGQQFTKNFTTAHSDNVVSPVRASGWGDQLLYPIEASLPPGSIRTVSVEYPDAQISILGWGIHWLWVFMIISILAGFALKGVLGVEV